MGGTSVFASENYRFEVMQSAISTMEVNGATITSKVRTTSATSPSGTESSFVTDTAAKAKAFPLGENFTFLKSNLVASQINETNELSGEKSFFVDLDLTTTNGNVSPVVDLGRASVNLIANRINNVAIYLTKGIALENPATSIRVFFAAVKESAADIKVLFKTLGSDQAKDFDELGFTFFNTDGSPDTTVKNSLADTDFQEYNYSAGVTDDGIGDPLPEFSQFQIKIVMQGTDAANPPRIKDLRIIALAT